ncbi:AQG_2a_G0009170.mRNA.1.CDS.1 [Saccharomyces cerevisiae]|jgi:uridine kinase|uniref:Putative uridine kinase DAS2 n=9 Tax=Saccharomyces TaxID=4930 RepID=DAS2_YEAST|nr:putative uridine kinase DAS2 [Saccharomyces cerevisiae S288C]Q12084.1 RecName: Full=Putative uridine kinase DAS2; AltName: Full=DST1-delta 6-azauracil sensitivity protein 2; AltName: Full=Regulator of rDNA transcription 3 [Saccharomyces cerevisiae S288C]AAS56897.1 YDR020C [Saccharomyces cerevisiae]AHY75018.1 Das2p [Saccharomyces cerevisiae YJM993]AJP37756.1 Das2p [Saccharomyces cerevisiae YJM1078]AJU57868.1 Das2p [Saccharomyces cerevisiae YJM189]AJU58573.1 Das2p [Saccharomyces cerevisiae Y|eukprot:NP_010303.3 putative uridine kinase DAS2 [Saccharomyces cerevisiae S288C]
MDRKAVEEKRIVISIGGGHATGVGAIALDLQNTFKSLYNSINIRVINLDNMIEGNIKSYNNNDYDFDNILNLVYEKHAVTSQNDMIQHDYEDPIDLIIVCGCYALYDKRINEISQLKVFLDSDADKRLISLIKKKNVGSNEQLAQLITEYMDHLRPEMQQYIEPTRTFADLIIPSTNENLGRAVLVDGIVKAIEDTKSQIEGNNTNNKIRPRLWDFEAETMDLEKDRYYDLS